VVLTTASGTPPTTTTTRPTTTTTTRPTTTGGTAKACTAAYSVVGSWPGGFQGEVKVTNSGTSSTSSWTLNWTFGNGQVISQSWGGKATQSGAAVTATNEAWNGALAPSASTSLGFIASWTTTNTAPAVTCTAS